MFESYYLGMQQDLKLAVIAPLLCAVFRYVFIRIYGKHIDWQKQHSQIVGCFRYGFWWGMDFNAYQYLIGLLLITLPAALLGLADNVTNFARLGWLLIYAAVLYTAFMGKMIFYYHYHDIYNRVVWLGKNADKKNLADIFFNQNHGWAILAGYVPYLALIGLAGYGLLQLPCLSLPCVEGVAAYALDVAVFLGSVAVFYWFRFGGTFRHRLKPEWDEVPAEVKEDIFLAKATVDDLIALEMVWKHPADESLGHSDDEAREIIGRLAAASDCSDWQSPLDLFKRRAKGARITPPRHIFFLFGEGHAQAPFDNIYDCLNLMEGTKKWRAQEHTFALDNFLSAGINSQTSIVGLLSGIYDIDMELNENKDFWYGNVPTSFALQMKKLGYHTELWYGGGTNWGSLNHYAPAAGFDRVEAGFNICPADAPRTWLGVYDHIFLERAAEMILAEDVAEPTFHFLYTTSNHGPYNMPYNKYGYNVERIMPDAPESVKKDVKTVRRFGGVWYADQALEKFIETMQAKYPDSLFVVTGDHATFIIPEGSELVARKSSTLRERFLTSFAMSHPELTGEMLAGNTLGGHLNILPTLMELLAPEGFEYYSLRPSLTEKLEHELTPYHWLDEENIGLYGDRITQKNEVTRQPLPEKHNAVSYAEEREALIEITAWMLRHPELMDDVDMGKRV